ncbi:MAG TPA: hypothetical protein VLS89_13660 [Candidatus Nanopelagicales bacterium]|nr:hypothetical protein [Candidatus Nanopelagicales bacterium]
MTRWTWIGAPVTLGALGLALAGCASEPAITAAEPKVVQQVPPAAVEGAYVPAGTDFVISLNQPIGTEATVPGSYFTAQVRTPIRGTDGQILVREGATVRGRVVEVDTLGAPSLTLDFISIETVRGPAALEAIIQSAEEYAYAQPNQYWDWTPQLGYDSILTTGVLPVGPGLGYEEVERELRLPLGAELRMALTRPLLPPGTTVELPEE